MSAQLSGVFTQQGARFGAATPQPRFSLVTGGGQLLGQTSGLINPFATQGGLSQFGAVGQQLLGGGGGGTGAGGGAFSQQIQDLLSRAGQSEQIAERRQLGQERKAIGAIGEAKGFIRGGLTPQIQSALEQQLAEPGLTEEEERELKSRAKARTVAERVATERGLRGGLARGGIRGAGAQAALSGLRQRSALAGRRGQTGIELAAAQSRRFGRQAGIGQALQFQTGVGGQLSSLAALEAGVFGGLDFAPADVSGLIGELTRQQQLSQGATTFGGGGTGGQFGGGGFQLAPSLSQRISSGSFGGFRGGGFA